MKNRLHRALRLVLLAGGGVLYVFQALRLFSYGVASVITTLLLFATLAYLCLRALSFAGRRAGMKQETRANVGLLVVSFFLCLTGADLYLRYGLARYASHEEANGAVVYTPVYKTATWQWIRQWRAGSGRLLVYRPHLARTSRQKEFSRELVTNSEGLRDREHARTKATGEFRLIALGDSYTEGLGAASESAWPQQLQGTLAGKGCSLTVMNGGVAGSDTFFEYALLKDRLLAYGPDVVVVALNTTDIDDYVVRGGMDRFKEDGTVTFRKGPSWEWIYASSYVVRHVAHDVLGYDRLLLRPRVRGSRIAQAMEETWAVLQSLSELSRERGFKLLLVFHPLRYEAVGKKLEFADLIRRLQKEQRIATLDLLDYYKRIEGISEANVDDYYWSVDGHHTARGYRAFAEGVAAQLLRLGWLPCTISAP